MIFVNPFANPIIQYDEVSYGLSNNSNYHVIVDNDFVGVDHTLVYDGMRYVLKLFINPQTKEDIHILESTEIPACMVNIASVIMIPYTIFGTSTKYSYSIHTRSTIIRIYTETKLPSSSLYDSCTSFNGKFIYAFSCEANAMHAILNCKECTVTEHHYVGESEYRLKVDEAMKKFTT